MIKLVEGLPANVVAAEAQGKVTSEDYDSVLMPAVRKASADGQKVRLLYVLGAEFTGYDAGAALDDAKMGMHHWGSFERIGLVTDNDLYRGLVKAFGFMMPGEVRVFSLAERSDGEAWVSGG